MDLAEALNIPVGRMDLVRVERPPIKILAEALSAGGVPCREPTLLKGFRPRCNEMA